MSSLNRSQSNTLIDMNPSPDLGLSNSLSLYKWGVQLAHHHLVRVRQRERSERCSGSGATKTGGPGRETTSRGPPRAHCSHDRRQQDETRSGACCARQVPVRPDRKCASALPRDRRAEPVLLPSRASPPRWTVDLRGVRCCWLGRALPRARTSEDPTGRERCGKLARISYRGPSGNHQEPC